MSWFGVLPPNQQSPYDRAHTPIRSPADRPRAGGRGSPAGGGAVAEARSPAAVAGVRQSQPPGSASLAKAAAAVLAQTSGLPAGQLYSAPASNAWAANGPKVSGGGALLAGDPHLPQTLPSLWYQVALSAPGLAVSGVSVPGLPGILIGHNAHIAWSLTDTQSQATLFYAEQTSAAAGQYFWRGQWRQMQVLHYTVPVRGGRPGRSTCRRRCTGPCRRERARRSRSTGWARWARRISRHCSESTGPGISPVQGRPGELAGTSAELRLRRRSRQHRRDLGRLLPAGGTVTRGCLCAGRAPTTSPAISGRGRATGLRSVLARDRDGE